MVTLFRVRYVFFFLSAWMGDGGGGGGGGGVGEAGDSPQPQFGVGDMWRVCVVDGWFTASPGLSQTDWTLAGWGCTPGVHEQSWHPRINQPSTHTLEEERESWPVYHQLGEYHQPVNSNKHLLYYIYPCPVSEEPKESHFGGVWRSNPATVTVTNYSSQKVIELVIELHNCKSN